MIRISSDFDAGNIHVVEANEAKNIQLEIKKDNQSDFYQWFYFRLTGAEYQECHITINNAGQAAYPKGFENYRVVASYDREHWFRIDTRYDANTLKFAWTPDTNAIYFAYFAPYSMERHHDLVAWASSHGHVHYEDLGLTLDGQVMDCLVFGDRDENKRSFWAIARQHPGETMAEWWMEGFIERLCDPLDPVVRALLDNVNIYVVPNMNPDGSRRGHLRTNAVGSNLNREWAEPSLEKSPEVYWVLQRMQSAGMDFCLDVHGDEALPYNFIAGAEGTPSWSESRLEELNTFKQTLMAISPDFQMAHGYPPSEPGQANMTICTNNLAERFQCLSMTLEMPFKDTIESPDDEQGWSPERCQRLGRSCVDAIYAHLRRIS